MDITWEHGVSWSKDKWKPSIPISEDLDPVKVREMALKSRKQADVAKINRQETNMIHWDDEADSLYILAIALEDGDSRIIDREIASLEEEIHEAVFANCLK